MDPENPCTRDCADRTAECHGKCERYTIWRSRMQERNAKIKEFAKANYAQQAQFARITGSRRNR